MKEEQKPISRLIEFAASYKNKYILSVLFAILGIAAGFAPFFVVSKIVLLLMNGEAAAGVYMRWCVIAGIGFLAKVCFANLSTLISHTATFATLAEICLRLVDKLTRVPMGYIRSCYQGNVPTLKDLYRQLMLQPEEEARGLALSSELFIKGSLNTFAQPTNVNTKSRIMPVTSGSLENS